MNKYLKYATVVGLTGVIAATIAQAELLPKRQPTPPPAEEQPSPPQMETTQINLPVVCGPFSDFRDQLIAREQAPVLTGANTAAPLEMLSGFLVTGDANNNYTVLLVNLESNVSCVISSGQYLTIIQ